jgi:hypothetical protein
MFQGVLQPLALYNNQCHKGGLGRAFDEHALIVRISGCLVGRDTASLFDLTICSISLFQNQVQSMGKPSARDLLSSSLWQQTGMVDL